ncbi:MAG: hypothetical protein ACRERC_19255 [Candidatus Binatia bacterium]
MSVPRMLVLLAVSVLAACQGESGGAADAPPGTSIDVKGLSLVLPAGWQQVPPSSGMRAAQAVIPGPGGPAELALFHFGVGQGGDVEANLQRWLGQIEMAPGAAPKREAFESNGLRVTWIDASGTLKPGQMGMGPREAQPGSRLLGAVIEGAGGPWFIKVTGANATLEPQRDAFVAMLRGAKPAA